MWEEGGQRRGQTRERCDASRGVRVSVWEPSPRAIVQSSTGTQTARVECLSFSEIDSHSSFPFCSWSSIVCVAQLILSILALFSSDAQPRATPMHTFLRKGFHSVTIVPSFIYLRTTLFRFVPGSARSHKTPKGVVVNWIVTLRSSTSL